MVGIFTISSNLERNQPEQAVKIFNKVITQGGLYEGYSRWYLAIIYLHQKNYEACREQLVALKKMDNHPNKKEIASLYRHIRFRNKRFKANPLMTNVKRNITLIFRERALILGKATLDARGRRATNNQDLFTLP